MGALKIIEDFRLNIEYLRNSTNFRTATPIKAAKRLPLNLQFSIFNIQF